MSQKGNHAGHRARLRERFLEEAAGSRSDEALLELLLTYAIPQKDVEPLVKKLLSKFGTLENVFAANVDELCGVNGLKLTSAALLKLADALQERGTRSRNTGSAELQESSEQPLLIPRADSETDSEKSRKDRAKRAIRERRGTELFGKAVLKEAIELLPRLPDTEDLVDVRKFLRNSLHFNGEQTRQRYAAYITRRMFPDGIADRSLRAFAKANESTPELKDVCFYRFCRAEPLMQTVIGELLLPALGLGRIRRERIIDYLENKFPESKSASDCTQAMVDALVAGGIAGADRKQITFSARPVRLLSFAFILHSEFPEPGIYEVVKAESNRLLSCMLWTPERILAALYELRNMGMISKISEIDSVRQFTLKFDLPSVVNYMVKERKPA